MLGLAGIVAGIKDNEWIMIILGVLITLSAVFNIGCGACLNNQCDINHQPKNKNDEFLDLDKT